VDLTGASFLYTLAALMITFAGFSALLLGIRQAAGIQPSPRQVSCQDRPDTTFHFSGGSAVAAAPFFVRRFRDVAVACLRRCFCSAYAESSPNVSTSPQKSGWQRSTADCIRRLRRIRLGSDTRDACLDLGRTVASTRRLYFRLIHQLFHACLCLYQGTRCDHAGTGRQPTR